MILLIVSTFFFANCWDIDRQKILDEAETWIGVPYDFGGRSRSGVDCSNYVNLVYIETGYPYTMCSTRCFREGSQQNLTKIRWEDVKIGDIIIYDSQSGSLDDPGHAGIVHSLPDPEHYKFIGSQSSTGVAIAEYCDFQSDPYCSKYFGTTSPIWGYYRYDPLNEYGNSNFLTEDRSGVKVGRSDSAKSGATAIAFLFVFCTLIPICCCCLFLFLFTVLVCVGLCTGGGVGGYVLLRKAGGEQQPKIPHRVDGTMGNASGSINSGGVQSVSQVQEFVPVQEDNNVKGNQYARFDDDEM